MTDDEKFVIFIRLFEGYEATSLKQILSSKYVIRNSFIIDFAKIVKAEDFEGSKEENVDMMIDLYGNE